MQAHQVRGRLHAVASAFACKGQSKVAGMSDRAAGVWSHTSTPKARPGACEDNRGQLLHKALSTPAISPSTEPGRQRTAFTMPSWPRNLRIVRPVATSHTKICLSPPPETSLTPHKTTSCVGNYSFAANRREQGSRSGRTIRHALAVVLRHSDVPYIIAVTCILRKALSKAGGNKRALCLVAILETCSPWYVLMAIPRWGFHRRIVRSWRQLLLLSTLFLSVQVSQHAKRLSCISKGTGGQRSTLPHDRQYVPELLKRTAKTGPSWPVKQNTSSVGRCSETSLLGPFTGIRAIPSKSC